MAKVTVSFDDLRGISYEHAQIAVGFRNALRGVMAGFSVLMTQTGIGFRESRRDNRRPKAITLDQFADLVPVPELIRLMESLTKSEHAIPALWIAEYLRHTERDV